MGRKIIRDNAKAENIALIQIPVAPRVTAYREAG
jgi:hypothetical protein